MNERRVADAVVDVIERSGAKTVFGIPGLHTLDLYDALAGRFGLRHVLTRHEQGAAFAADGYARVTGGPGLVSTTTGPGTFNTLAALAEAWSDSSPVVVLAGQIDSALDGLGRGVLHETPDQGRSFEALTAYVGRPRTAADVPAAVAEGIRASMTGRRRPAYVELPTDLLGSRFDAPLPAITLPGPVEPEQASIAAAARVLAVARRIIVVAGAGVQRASASSALRRVAARVDAPILTPITGAGAIPADDDLAAGMLAAGRPEVAALLEEADATLVVGCRLDDTQTGRRTLPLRNVVQIDVEARAVGRAYPVAAGVVGDARLALEALDAELRDRRGPVDPAWGRVRARAARAAFHDAVALTQYPTRDAMVAARAALPRDAILTHDAARLNSWTGYFWPVYEPDGSIFPWGSATLGFSVGTAIGAAVAAPGRRVVASCGDGGFLFTAMELATAVANQLDVTFFVHDDAAFGSIAAYQQRFHGRSHATDLVNPDFVAFAGSFGIPAERVDAVADLPSAMARAVAASGPSLVVLAGPLEPPW